MDSIESQDDADSRTCFVCSQVLASKSSLFRHVRRKHPYAEDYTRTAISASSVCFDLCLLLRCVFDIFQNTNLPYNCAICSKGFVDLRVLSQHQKRHQPKSLQCPHCNRRYAFKNEMRKHLHRVHKIEYKEIPEDLTEYAKLTEDGEIYKDSHAGRPFKKPDVADEEASVAIDEHDEKNSEIKSQCDEAEQLIEHEDDDEDVDDLLLQKLSESNEVQAKKEDIIVETKEEDESDEDEDVDDLLLQQLNS